MGDTFAGRLAKARKRAKLSQESAAEESGVSRTMISRYETGESEPKIQPLTALARAYSVSPTWLLTGHGPRKWNPADESENAEEEMRRAMKMVAGWLRERAESGDSLRTLEASDVEVMEDPGGGKDGRDLGKPRRDTG